MSAQGWNPVSFEDFRRLNIAAVRSAIAAGSAADPAHPYIASHEAELRLRVLTAASVLVDRLTYDAVTMDAVARASGVSKSTLYHYWPSRQVLVLESFAYKTNLLTNVDDTGDVARDLHAYLVALTYCLKVGGAASTVANLLAEAIRSEEFAVQFRARHDHHNKDPADKRWKQASGAAGQVSAVTWLTMTINTYNRIAISGAYTVAPSGVAGILDR